MEHQTSFCFIEEAEERERDAHRLKVEADQIKAWKDCWNWDGPKVGGSCEINSCGGTELEGGGTTYAYMENCTILEELPDNRWLCCIAMGLVDGKPWRKNGTRVILGIRDIWPPTRIIREKRRREGSRATA